MNKYRKYISFTMIFVVLFTVLASTGGFTDRHKQGHQHHHGTEQRCPSCMQAQVVNKVVSGFGMTSSILTMAAFLYMLALICAVLYEPFCTTKTLVNMKVELLN